MSDFAFDLESHIQPQDLEPTALDATIPDQNTGEDPIFSAHSLQQAVQTQSIDVATAQGSAETTPQTTSVCRYTFIAEDPSVRFNVVIAPPTTAVTCQQYNFICMGGSSGCLDFIKATASHVKATASHAKAMTSHIKGPIKSAAKKIEESDTIIVQGERQYSRKRRQKEHRSSWCADG